MTIKQYLVLDRVNLSTGASVVVLSRTGKLLQLLLPLNHPWMPDMIVPVKGLRLKFGWMPLWGHHLAQVTDRLSDYLKADAARAWRAAYNRQILCEV